MLTPMDDRTTNEWVEPQADECGERNQAQALQGAEHMLGWLMSQDYFGHKLWCSLRWNMHVHPKVRKQLQDWDLQDSSVQMLPVRHTQQLELSSSHTASDVTLGRIRDKIRKWVRHPKRSPLFSTSSPIERTNGQDSRRKWFASLRKPELSLSPIVWE